jgi:nicotinamide-nucleotide amidase
VTPSPRSSRGPRRLESATILAIGDELLAGAHPDLNSPVIARRLGTLGLSTREVRVVADDEGAIADAVSSALGPDRLLVVTGGLGPTLDDVTRHAIARALGVELETSREVAEGLESWFGLRGLEMAETNLRQALFPRGAIPIPNRAGTAPGFRFERGGGWGVALPGPPREMSIVLEEEVLPWLRREGLVGEPAPEQRFFLFGLPESDFAERAGRWMDRDATSRIGPRIGCSAKGGVLTVVLRAPDASPEARAALLERSSAFRTRFAGEIYSETTPRLEEVLGRALIEGGIPFAVAESCTGGRVASRLTGVAGISAVFSEGFVTYADEAKSRSLGVDAALIEEKGAVSREVAEAMAAGVARVTGARLTVAITGVAGPGGGCEEKPVGLVHFATALDGEVHSTSRRFSPRDREWVQSLSANSALLLAWRRLREAGLAPSPPESAFSREGLRSLRPDAD